MKLNGEESIECPKCHHDNLHQVSVKVYSRREDDKITRETTIDNIEGDISHKEVKSVNSANPSGRRQGLIISFTCEQCDEKPRLKIYQHKGATYIEW